MGRGPQGSDPKHTFAIRDGHYTKTLPNRALTQNNGWSYHLHNAIVADINHHQTDVPLDSRLIRADFNYGFLFLTNNGRDNERCTVRVNYSQLSFKGVVNNEA